MDTAGGLEILTHAGSMATGVIGGWRWANRSAAFPGDTDAITRTTPNMSAFGLPLPSALHGPITAHTGRAV